MSNSSEQSNFLLNFDQNVIAEETKARLLLHWRGPKPAMIVAGVVEGPVKVSYSKVPY